MNFIRRLDSRKKLLASGDVHWSAFVCEKKQGAPETELSFHEDHAEVQKNNFEDYRRFWAKPEEGGTRLPGLCFIKESQWDDPELGGLRPKSSPHDDDPYGPFHWDIKCPCKEGAKLQPKRLAFLATENKVLCGYEKEPAGERRPSDPNFKFGVLP